MKVKQKISKRGKGEKVKKVAGENGEDVSSNLHTIHLAQSEKEVFRWSTSSRMIREKAEIERERYRHRKTQKGVVKIGPQTDRHRDKDRQRETEREKER